MTKKSMRAILNFGLLVLMLLMGGGYKAYADNIQGYFSNYLNGNTAEYTKSSQLKADKIELNRSKVWNAWKKANENFKEEKLGPVENLTKKNAHKWSIPESLEPNASLPFYFGAKGSKPESGYPFYLYLHGSGPKDMEWETGFTICNMFDDAPSIYFIPQVPNEGQYYRWWQKSKQYAWGKLLRQILVSGEVDPNRLYVFGISEGGYGSQRLASFYADYLAGAGPMAGGEPLRNAPPENCRNIAFSLITGANDYGFYRNTLSTSVLNAFDSLQRKYPDEFVHRVMLVPNCGHSVDYRLTTPWLKQYTRNPYPKHVTWEDYDMDGLYRSGFYNLYVRERANAQRVMYEMDINDNCVDLKVSKVEYDILERDPRFGIEMRVSKRLSPVDPGKLVIYLCDELVDTTKPVTVTVNGKQVYKGMLKADLKNMVNSCAEFFDPMRVYPYAVEVK